MAAKNEVAARKGVLMSLFNKPRTEYVGKEGETITVTPQVTDMVFIRSCKQCKFGVHGKAAKCIIESSSDVRVDFEEPLMTGTLELISCKDITISINPQDKLPTVTAERCENIHLYYYEPQALGSVYTVKCTNIYVHLQPPYPSEMLLDIPLPEASNDQFVSTYKPQGKKMVAAKVIREGGGYATTEEALKQAEMREREMQRCVEAYLKRLITVTKPSPGRTPQSKPGPPASGTPSKPPPPPAAAEPATTTPKETRPPTPPPSDPDQSSLASALQAKKGDLKPTEVSGE